MVCQPRRLIGAALVSAALASAPPLFARQPQDAAVPPLVPNAYASTHQ